MPETYKPVFAGNVVQHINSFANPNASFRTNNRPVGFPDDRAQQAQVVMPGWMAVRKVGYAVISNTPASLFPIIVPSPDQREGDKPRPDINGLFVPQGGIVIRAGFRVLPVSAQPYASAPRDTPAAASGLLGTATDKVILASALPAASAAGSITGTVISTGSDGTAAIVTAGLEVPVGSFAIQTAFGSPVAITQSGGLTLSLYCRNTAVNANGTIRAANAAGVYVLAELCYLVQEGLAELDDVYVQGARYSGFGA